MDFSTDLEHLVIGASYPNPLEPDEQAAMLLIFSMGEKDPTDHIFIDYWQSSNTKIQGVLAVSMQLKADKVIAIL